MILITMLSALLLGAAAEYDYENLTGDFRAELRYVTGPGQGLREGQDEVTHVSLALLGPDGKRTEVIDSNGETDRPYRFNSGRLPAFEIAKQLEKRGILEKRLGLSGPSYQLFVAGLPFPFGPKDGFQGNQELDLGLHVSLYNQPASAQYGAEYTPPTIEDVNALAEKIGSVAITTKDIVIINGSELNDMKAGGCYYLALSVDKIDGKDGADYARFCQDALNIEQSNTQKFHITAAAVGPSWRSHPKAGRIETPGDMKTLKLDKNVPRKWDMPMAAPCAENAERFDMPLVELPGGKFCSPTCGPDYTLFRRGTNVHKQKGGWANLVRLDSLLKPEHALYPYVVSAKTSFAGWDNNASTGWTTYCDGATFKTNANNVLKNAWVGAKGALQKAQAALEQLRQEAPVRQAAGYPAAQASSPDIDRLEQQLRALDQTINSAQTRANFRSDTAMDMRSNGRTGEAKYDRVVREKREADAEVRSACSQRQTVKEQIRQLQDSNRSLRDTTFEASVNEHSAKIAQAQTTMEANKVAADAARLASALENQDILTLQGFPTPVGQSEHVMTLAAPSNQEELLAAITACRGDVQKILKIQ